MAIVAHGGSGPKAIKNAIRVGIETVSHDVNRHIVETLNEVAELSSTSDEKLPRRLWRRVRSKLEGLGDKPAATTPGKENKGGGNN